MAESQKIQVLKLEDPAPEHFAPSKEKVSATIEHVVGDGERIDRLWCVVTDREERPVFRSVWARPGVKPNDPEALLVDSKGPPETFEWSGEVNLGGRGGFVTPLGSPYRLRSVAHVSPVPKSDPPLSEDLPGQVRCPYADPPPKLLWALKRLQVVASGKRSRSCTVREHHLGLLVLPGGNKADRFTYATGAESGVSIEWELSDDAKPTKGTLELFARGKDAALWTKELDASALGKKSLAITGPDLDAWNKALLVKDSPFQVRLKVEGDDREAGHDIAWTYIEVLVDSLTLEWGAGAALPTEEGWPAETTKEELLLLRKLKGAAAPKTDPDGMTLDALLKDDPPPAAAKDAAHTLELRHNIFYQDVKEWSNGTALTKSKALWGDGPRLPLVARLKVRSASGAAVDAPLALVGVQVLFDWDDPTLDKERGLETEAWLRWALRRVPATTTDDGPASTNCPGDYGGKRGANGKPVFPELPGTSEDPGNFPFKVAKAPKRPWAALADVKTEGANKGCAGVLFRPSRIAGDTYRVRAYLHHDADSFDKAITGVELWRQAGEVGLPRAAAGTFEVWRRVDILRWVGKLGALPATDFARVNQKFAPARIRFDVDATPVDVATLWTTGLNAVIAEIPEAADLPNELGTQSPKDGFFFTRKTFNELMHPKVLAALKRLPNSTRKQKLLTDYDKPAPPPNFMPLWQQATVVLSPAELDTLGTELGTHITGLGAAGKVFEAIDQASLFTHTNDRSATLAATTTLMTWLLAGRQSGEPLSKFFLTGLAARLILDPVGATKNDVPATLRKKQGMIVFQAESVVPSCRSFKGSAFPLKHEAYTPTGGDPAMAATAGRFAGFYACTPHADGLVEVKPALDMGKPCPGQLRADMTLMLTSNPRQPSDDAFAQDRDAALVVLANASMHVVLGKMTADKVVPREHKVDKRSPGRERDIDLWWDFVQIKVIGGTNEAARRVQDMLRRFVEAAQVEQVTNPNGNDQHVYLSRSKTLDQDAALRLVFGAGQTSLHWKDNDEKILAWLKGVYGRSFVAVDRLYVHHRTTSNGKARGKAVAEYLGHALREAKLKVKVNPKLRIRAIPAPDLDERHILVSRAVGPMLTTANDQALDAVRKDGSTVELVFDRHSASIHKRGIDDAIENFVKATLVAQKGVPEVTVFFKDTKEGRHRRMKVVDYLDLLLGAADRSALGLDDPPLPTEPLLAHEMAHTLFLEHARPKGSAEEADWRHVEGHNCLMNYDAARLEFCGLCLLALRGWDIGTRAAAKFPPESVGYPRDSSGASVVIEGDDHGEEEEEPSKEPAEVWNVLGWHGTSSEHRASLRGGLKVVESAWDPSSGGELGPGFYVTRDYPTACLYGAGIAGLKSGMTVDIWVVESKKKFSEFTLTPVPADKQYAKITQELCKAPNHVLHNAAEDPPIQLKFNSCAYADLRIRNVVDLTVEEAFKAADERAEAPVVVPDAPVVSAKPSRDARRPARVVPTKGDGDCFFYSVAYFVKSSEQERANFADGQRTYGDDPAEVTNAEAVRLQVADWLAVKLYDVRDRAALVPPEGRGGEEDDEKVDDNPADFDLTEAGERYERLWDRLTNEGQDVAHWGPTLLDTVRDLPVSHAQGGKGKKAGNLVWGDVQFLSEALLALYPDYKRIVVHHGALEPQVFPREGAVGKAMLLHFRNDHYEVVLGMEA